LQMKAPGVQPECSMIQIITSSLPPSLPPSLPFSLPPLPSSALPPSPFSTPPCASPSLTPPSFPPMSSGRPGGGGLRKLKADLVSATSPSGGPFGPRLCSSPDLTAPFPCSQARSTVLGDGAHPVVPRCRCTLAATPPPPSSGGSGGVTGNCSSRGTEDGADDAKNAKAVRVRG